MPRKRDGVRTVTTRRILPDILHGLRRLWDRRGELRGGGQRVSRHYYDVYRLLASETGREAMEDAAMAEDCVRHARMFFNRPDLDLASAVPEGFVLTPHDGMLADLRRAMKLWRAWCSARYPPSSTRLPLSQAWSSTSIGDLFTLLVIYPVCHL